MLVINNISFQYKQQKNLNHISFKIDKGEHIAVMGESGCGKSTLLKAIYGLLDLNEGSISYNDELLFGPQEHLVPGHPFMKFLTQQLNIMPFTTVFENVAEHLSRFYMDEREKRTLELIQVVDLMPFKDTKVKNLSGGQKQRVALAKVLAKEPEILLLDEPFSQIDHFRKNELRYRLFSYLKSKKISCITATHDRNDVLPFADEIIIMRNGKITTKNNPQTLYQQPFDVYSASLFSEVNEVPANLFFNTMPETNIILYPDEISITSNNHGVNGVVEKCYYLGEIYVLKISVENLLLTIKHHKAIALNTMLKITCSKKLIEERL